MLCELSSCALQLAAGTSSSLLFAEAGWLQMLESMCLTTNPTQGREIAVEVASVVEEDFEGSW